MVSRVRVTVLLVAMVVVVMALGIIGVLGTVGSASPDNGKGRSTLTVLTTETREARVADLDPQGLSYGDMRVVNAPLHNESGKKKVGRLDMFCVLTDPGEKVHMTECVRTYTLAGGEISTQGVTAYPELSELPARDVNAITGGTGRYAGVEGEVRLKTRANKVFITFRFID
jgi:allene oxide cyclase-like protein